MSHANCGGKFENEDEIGVSSSHYIFKSVKCE